MRGQKIVLFICICGLVVACTLNLVVFAAAATTASKKEGLAVQLSGGTSVDLDFLAPYLSKNKSATDEFTSRYVPYMTSNGLGQTGALPSAMLLYVDDHDDNERQRRPKTMLQSLCVLGSFNSACTGRFYSVQAVALQLYLGFRYLDVEIFCADSGAAAATANTPLVGCYETRQTCAPLPFTSFCAGLAATLNTFATRNNGEFKLNTLFLQLRIVTKLVTGNNGTLAPDDRSAFFQAIRTALVTHLGSFLYTDSAEKAIKINPATYCVDDLVLHKTKKTNNKIIIVLDKLACPFFNDPTLVSVTNLLAGVGSDINVMYADSVSSQRTHPWNLCYPSFSSSSSAISVMNLFGGNGGGGTADGDNPDAAVCFVNGVQIPLLDMTTFNDDANLQNLFLVFSLGRKSYLTIDEAVTRVYYLRTLTT